MGFSLAEAKLILDGLAAIERIETKIDDLGVHMTQANAALQALQAQLADTSADVLAKLDQLTQQLGTLPADAQATLDSIVASVQGLDTTVGDADGSDTPPTP